MKHLILVVLFLFPLQVDAVQVVRVRRQITKQVKHTKSSVVDSRNAVLKSTPRSDSTDLSAKKGKSVSDLSWEDMKLIAVKVARKYDIHPAVLVGMTTLESGGGKSYYCLARNNCGGIGAYDRNPDNAFHFANYYDYVDYLARLISGDPKVDKMQRYLEAYKVRHDPYAMVAAIKAGGYASDDKYVEKVTSLPEFKDYIY